MRSLTGFVDAGSRYSRVTVPVTLVYAITIGRVPRTGSG